MTVACALAPGMARAQGPTTPSHSPLQVGVVLVEVEDISSKEALDISSKLGAALQRELLVDVVAGEDAARRLSFEISDECVASASCVEQVSTALGVEQVLFLVVVRISDSIQLNATWTDFRSDQIATRSPIIIKVGNDMKPIFAAAATALLPNAPRRPAAKDVQQDRPPDRPISISDNKPPSETPARGRRITLGSAIVASVGAVALAGGTWLGITALSDKRDLEEECRFSGCYDSDAIDSVKTKAILSDVLLAAAAGAGIAAGVLYLRSGQREPDGVGLTVTPSQASLQLRLSF